MKNRKEFLAALAQRVDDSEIGPFVEQMCAGKSAEEIHSQLFRLGVVRGAEIVYDQTVDRLGEVDQAMAVIFEKSEKLLAVHLGQEGDDELLAIRNAAAGYVSAKWSILQNALRALVDTCLELPDGWRQIEENNIFSVIPLAITSRFIPWAIVRERGQTVSVKAIMRMGEDMADVSQQEVEHVTSVLLRTNPAEPARQFLLWARGVEREAMALADRESAKVPYPTQEAIETILREVAYQVMGFTEDDGFTVRGIW